MIYMHMIAIISIILFVLCFHSRHPHLTNPTKIIVITLFVSALLPRLALAYSNTGFPADTSCFAAWAARMYELGPGAFYSADVFTDYPPGYMYILYLIGWICAKGQIATYSGLHLILLKLPAIICDLVCGWLIYREARSRCQEHSALLLTATYLFNPVILLNSSVWGQVDSLFTLMVLLMCLYLMKGRLIPAYIVFGIGILLKPQTLVFTPVLLVGILDQVFLQNFTLKKLVQNLFGGIGVLIGMVLLCMPFGLDNCISRYTTTLGSYAYASVNAYNFWGFLGLSWTSQEHTFLGITYLTYGTVAILLIVLFTFFLGWKLQKKPYKYPLLGAFVILSMFLFSVRMHERYLYPALILLLLTYLYHPDKETAVCYGLFSVLHFYNVAHVYFFYDVNNYDRRNPVILIVSGAMLVSQIYFYQMIWHTATGIRGNRTHSADACLKRWIIRLLSPAEPRPSRKAPGLQPIDLILMVAVTLLYSLFALHDLGDHAAPVTTYDMTENQIIELDFGENAQPVSMSYYIAPWHNRTFQLAGKDENAEAWIFSNDITLNAVFTWSTVSLEEGSRYVQLTLADSQASILELVFLDAEGQMVIPVNAADYRTLFDESSLYPERSTFRNSMYFDEIYHARTAYEFLHGQQSYENTHPPLGKIFISIGVALFGMNPFGWRIIGTLFGIAMVPMFYLFGKRVTHNTPAAALGSVLFAFDFMHFTQTRIATIDVYITFFVLLMYFFMYQYYQTNFYDTPLRKTLLPLGACGLCMGLGVASKWTGVYAGVGLALIFFSVLLRRYREYRYAKAAPEKSTQGISHQKILENFPDYCKKTIGFCMIFFVAIPALIYLLSYIPFVDADQSGLLSRLITNQESMLHYHSTLESTHPYSSSWYEWPSMVRPIWYYSGIVSDTLREGISAFGNPLVWWIGIPAFVFTLLLAIRRKERTAAFLCVGYLAQYLPWFFVTRITFIYHYFPSVPFVVLMILYCLMEAKKELTDRQFLGVVLTYGACTFGLFLLFYPVLSGQPVEAAYVDRFLRWFNTWVLVAR